MALSIDTRRGAVMDAALSRGVSMVNDITALGDDPDASRMSFPVHGLVALEAVGDRWLERWRLGQ